MCSGKNVGITYLATIMAVTKMWSFNITSKLGLFAASPANNLILSNRPWDVRHREDHGYAPCIAIASSIFEGRKVNIIFYLLMNKTHSIESEIRYDCLTLLANTSFSKQIIFERRKLWDINPIFWKFDNNMQKSTKSNDETYGQRTCFFSFWIRVTKTECTTLFAVTLYLLQHLQAESCT